MAEPSKIATLCEDRQCNDWSDSRNGTEAFIISLTLQALVNLLFKPATQFCEMNALLENEAEHIHSHRARRDGNPDTVLRRFVILSN